jgi:parallel beta-helix repeat protein
VSCIGAANEITIKPGTSVIQSAVNKATSGDVIILNPGNYFDNVKITKANLTIKSSSGNPDDTWIKSKISGADVFLLQADSININGLKISGSTATGRSAINLSSCRYCAIENNKLLNNARGIYLLSAHWNAISKNTAASDTEYGIVLGNSTANIISGNAAYNDGRGIHIGNSDSNTLCGNTVRDNSVLGLYVCPKSDRNTIYNNYFNDVNISIKNGTGNLYNTAKTAGTNIVGGPYIGGNYWAKPDGTGFSQKAVDEDENGISDSAYTSISGSVYSDSLPLVTPGSAPILPIADFKSDVTSGSSPLTVMFTNTSTNTANVSWNFGDGTAAVTGTQVSHTFTNTGTSAQTFTVTLTAINPNGTNTKTGTITVNPAAAVVKPVASFDVSPSSGGTTATTYTFTDTSKKTPTSWSWDFGDKTALDKAKSVTHKYAKT